MYDQRFWDVRLQPSTGELLDSIPNFVRSSVPKKMFLTLFKLMTIIKSRLIYFKNFEIIDLFCEINLYQLSKISKFHNNDKTENKNS